MKVRTSLFALFFTLSSLALSAQNATFEKRAYGDIGSRFHADFNNDGREDFITGGTGVFRISLSTGDGIYAWPVNIPLPAGNPSDFAIGDFNQDGNADVIVSTGSNHFYTYYGHGDGTFSAPITNVLPTGQVALSLAAGDFNHDGRTDLAFVNSNGSSGEVHVYFANPGGGWTVGPVTSGVAESQILQVGDFDGDGKADLMAEQHDMGTGLKILYGDGAGHFTVVPVTDLNRGIYYEVRDANGDGISDLVGSDWVYTTNGQNLRPTMQIIYGHSGRTLSQQILTFTRCNNGMPAETADVNGDGLTDLIFVEESSCDGGSSDVVVATRNGDGTYNAPQVVDSPGFDVAHLTVLRANRDTKADVAAVVFTSTNAMTTDVLLNNTATGTFPGCAAPNAFRGISVCAPTTSATSPVHFSIGAATQTAGRKVEVWIDGAKKAEQLKQQFSRYAYLDTNVSLANGTHSVTLYAAGFDNLLQKQTFSVTVGSGGGGGSCPAPANSNTVVICAPTSGSTVTAPVHVSAAGGSSVTFMEVWVDGAKMFQNSGNHVETDLPLANGTHTMKVYGRNGSVIGQASVTFTVGSGGATCAQPASSTGTVICAPANGSTVSSPVTIQARGGANVTYMEAWVDGTKRFQNSGSSIFASLSLAPGSHRLSVYSKNGTGVLSNAVSNFTVK